MEVHWSSVIVFIWFALALPALFRDYLPDLSTWTITAMVFASVLLLEGSVLLHELGHSLQGRREGMHAERIFLYALGGLALISGGRPTPGADFRVTAAGPLVTLVIAAVTAPLAFLAESSGWPDLLLGLLAFLAIANAGMFAFNLLPVYPLDGGRLLHATLWRARGYTPASALTTRVGLATSATLIAAGALVPFFVAGIPPLTGARVVFWGGVLLAATYAVRPPVEAAPPPLVPRQVGHLLWPQPITPAPETELGEFLDLFTRAGPQAAAVYPVVEDGKVVGVISPGLAADALAEGRTVAEAMIQKGEAVVLQPEMSIEEAYEALGGRAKATGVVLYENRVAGILRGSDLAAALLEARESPHGMLAPAAPPRLTMDW